VTQGGRLPLLRAAVRDYCRQSYPHRELVIVVDGTRSETARIRDFVAHLGRGDIRVVRPRVRRSLGALRNVSIDASIGDVLCQWDDDDRYHPERLAVQFGALARGEAHACFFREQLYYFTERAELYAVDWRQYRGWPVPVPSRTFIPGTVMWRRCELRYPASGAAAHRGEDSAFALQLTRRGVVGVPEAAHCYLRVYHGRNCWPREHHVRNVHLRGRSVRQLLPLRRSVETALAVYELPLPVRVMGRDGVAFVLAAPPAADCPPIHDGAATRGLARVLAELSRADDGDAWSGTRREVASSS
jgi:glycosyltransferase involved in cell wall biosynthesis